MKFHAVKRALVLFLCATLALSGEISFLTDATATEVDSTMEQTTDRIGNSNDIPVYTIYNPIVISDGRENHQLSDEELSADTCTLLGNVLNSEYVRIARRSARILSSNADPLPTNYNGFNGFAELLTRVNLESVVLTYMNNASDSEFSILQDMLFNSDLCERVSEETVQELALMSVQRYQNTIRLVDPPNDADFAGEFGISRYSAGTITFRDGEIIPVYRTSREYTAAERAEVDSYYSMNNPNLNAMLIHSADVSYNCHSYAWYHMDNNNNYWILNEDMSRPQSATIVSNGDVQMYDIIVYHKRNEIFLHSGVVVDVSSDGTIWVQSKWGQAGVYRHRIDAVPSGYLDNGTLFYTIYRYHWYDRTTEDLGHVGTRHLYQHTDNCRVCPDSVVTTARVVCSGPPCYVPFSMRNLDE